MSTTNSNTTGQFLTPGYEHLKSIYLLKDVQKKTLLHETSIYILPLMALQSAYLALIEYIDLTGQKIDPLWCETDWHSLPIQERIAHIYRKAEQPTQFNTGIWKEVLMLLETGRSIGEDLAELKLHQKNEIPEKFKSIAVEYPIYRSQATAEEAIDILLDLSDFCKSDNKKTSIED